VKEPRHYFRHDNFPENKDSFRNLLDTCGIVGYAVYYRLKELLYQSKTAELNYENTVTKIANFLRYNAPDKVRKVRNALDFMLLEDDFKKKHDDLELIYYPEKGTFQSLAVVRDKIRITSTSEKRAEAGRKGGRKKQMLRLEREKELREAEKKMSENFKRMIKR
jgi:hypothetical protein